MAECKKTEVCVSHYVLSINEIEAKKLRRVLMSVSDDDTDNIFYALGDVGVIDSSSKYSLKHYSFGVVGGNDMTLQKIED